MNTKNQVYAFLAACAVKTAKDNAVKANGDKPLDAKFGRVLDIPSIVEYLEGVPLTGNLAGLIKSYLTAPTMHKYEIAREGAKTRKAEKEAANAKIYAEFGF